MGFDPLEEKGLPLEDQIRSWRELNVEPFDPDTVHPCTRCRVIVMNGIEVEALMFSAQFTRHTNDAATGPGTASNELLESSRKVRRVRKRSLFTELVWQHPNVKRALAVTGAGAMGLPGGDLLAPLRRRGQRD